MIAMKYLKTLGIERDTEEEAITMIIGSHFHLRERNQRLVQMEVYFNDRWWLRWLWSHVEKNIAV